MKTYAKRYEELPWLKHNDYSINNFFPKYNIENKREIIRRNTFLHMNLNLLNFITITFLILI